MRSLASVKRALRRAGLAAVAAAALATPAWAQVEIQWWHAMAGPNGERIVKIANDFNGFAEGVTRSSRRSRAPMRTP